MGDFHEYYSGKRAAPYLTVFTGGNHEASNYMFELHYGGWVAPNIYYMGASNVLRFGPLRIAGISGIWKGYDYNKPHHERLPYTEDDVKSAYHVREFDVRKLLQIRTQVDIGLSHDWPRSIERHGNFRELFSFKKHFEPDSLNGTLGSVAVAQVMERLRPQFWFGSHMHCKFVAVRRWETPNLDPQQSQTISNEYKSGPHPVVLNEDEIDLEMDDEEAGDQASAPATSESGSKVVRNEDEIDLNLNEDDETLPNKPSSNPASSVPQELLAQLPPSFIKRQPDVKPSPQPPDITNTTTHFLALDKHEPGKHFLQLQSITPLNPSPPNQPLHLSYDPEWLAITRVFALEGSPLTSPIPPNKGSQYYATAIDEAKSWVQTNILDKGISLQIPADFEIVAPVYDEALGDLVEEQPREWPNPQTARFCTLLGVKNHFGIGEEEIVERMRKGPETRVDSGWKRRGRDDFTGRGGLQGRGSGRGRGRGGRYRGFGYRGARGGRGE
jgi:lariat debranching enzyme